jgi:hypothetical protein
VFKKGKRIDAALHAAVLALAVCSGCVARYVRVGEQGMTCVEAQRIAINAVRRMGYTISETTKATPNAPGMIVAAREVGTSKQGMLVHVFCTSQGAEVEAQSAEGGLSQLNFANDFRQAFATAAADRAPPRAPAQAGVDVLLTPERGGGVAQLGVDLSTAGVLPVSVRITNHTGRAYRFIVGGVELQTAAGERSTPLKLDELGKKLDADALRTLRAKALGDHDIEPNATLTGFLFFPFNAYTRARVELIDSASDETEGFAIEL